MPLSSHVVASPDPQEVAAFFDEILPRQLDEYHVPGAAIAVVKDGETVFAKGYGFADLEEERPVVADRTLFRTGSVAKLFTSTAAMQLVEQGELDLNSDINDYLNGFRIPDTYPEPVTLENLLTHTAGFEDASMGMMRASPADLEPLGTFLAREIPTRVFPPGRVTAYSNYGMALAGYMVEEASGLSFEEYVEQNIFRPLGMDRTTFRQPVPASMAEELATGYSYSDGVFQSQPFEVYQIAPAGSASATVSDMARFMMAHLQGGRHEDVRILDKSTAQRMHRRHFGNDPRVAGMAYGFYELPVKGRLLLTHAGEASFFRSQLYLLPEEELGLYVVYNAPGGGPARQDLIEAFLGRFYATAPIALPQPPAGAAQRARQLEGQYISTRSAQTTIEKLRLLLMPAFQPIVVRATEDGYLETHHPGIRSQDPDSYQASRWVETEPNLYTRATGESLAFSQNGGGHRMLFFDSSAPRGYRRLAPYEELLFQPLLPLGMLVILLGALVFGLFDRQALPAARWLTVGAGGVLLVFMLGLVAFAFLGFVPYLYGRVSPAWWVVFALPMILVLLTIGLAATTLRPWPHAGLIRRVPYAVAVVAAGVMLLWASYWNLIGWKF